MRSRWIKILLACLAFGLSAGALAEGLSKLPQDYKLPQSKKSPGVVTFKHQSHVKPDAADCTSCHPKLFKITEKGKTADGEVIKHAKMKKGGQCGFCHDGTKSFGLDECEKCHAETEE
jgi:c(7)-type cytochrome triheme protein